MPPALVSSPDDLVEYHVDSADAVEKSAKPGYIERYIHSEIYKRYPNINSVVHSHSSDVLPYCISGVPLKNTIHMAGFLGRCTCRDLGNTTHTAICRNQCPRLDLLRFESSRL